MFADLSTTLVPATNVTLTLSPGEAEALLPAINDLFLSSDKYTGATKEAVDALWTTAVEGATALSYI